MTLLNDTDSISIITIIIISSITFVVITCRNIALS